MTSGRMLKKTVSKAAGESKPEAYPRGTLRISMSRERSWRAFSASCRLFLPLRQNPLHPHPYHHIRILHQQLDRIPAPVVADRLERRRRRQAGKPITVGKHVDKGGNRFDMFDLS